MSSIISIPLKIFFICIFWIPLLFGFILLIGSVFS